ncbi:GlxA family transcriptional regulator [Vogesella amnigena]|uniref:GlxA family transcriptional regulator n=1 Tax=Vogesella amnigena TaxID=1507449 RepID=A0ABV7TQ68_9NEIS
MDIWFLLTPRYLALDFVGPAEALRMAIDEGAPFRLRVAGPARECVSSLGLASLIDPLPEVLADGSLVVLCGTVDEDADYATPEAQQLVAWLRRHITPQVQLATICSGALLAGMAGLLDGRSCTTHHSIVGKLAAVAPAARVLDNRIFVEDGNIATSAGITTGMDLALALIERHAGADIAARVARRMVLYMRRSGDDPQLSPWLAYRNHLHPAVHRAQDLIAREPAQRWAVEELAGRVHLSPRHLTRLFREQAGVGIVEYQQRLRISLVRQLLQQGVSVERAAEGAGFGSARDMRRVWSKYLPGSPGRPAV